MTNKNISPIRLSEEYMGFSDKLQTNRVKLGVDKKTIGHRITSKLIDRYFKMNNDRYLELANMSIELVEEKNA